MDYQGVIIAESLKDKSFLQSIKIIKTKIEKVTDKHKTPWLKQWTLYTVKIPKNKAEKLAKKISQNLDRNYWYSDYKNNQYHYIIFPNIIFKVDLNNPVLYQDAISFGISLGIPNYQLDFVADDKLQKNTPSIIPVILKIKKLNQFQAKKLLDQAQANCKTDSKIGIFIAKLPIEPIIVDEERYYFFAARVLPSDSKGQNYVKPHYHQDGSEIYYYISGDIGEMNTGIIKDKKIVWRNRIKISPGQISIISENEIHTFSNLGKKPFDFLFSCPKQHLTDQDRKIIDKLPPWQNK